MPPPPRTGTKAKWTIDAKSVKMLSNADGSLHIEAALVDNGTRVATFSLDVSVDRAVRLGMLEEVEGAFNGGRDFTAWVKAAGS